MTHSLEALEKRIRNAQVYLAYIKNILERHQQAFLSEKVHLYGQDIEVLIQFTSYECLWETLMSLLWYMDITNVELANDRCVFWVSLKESKSENEAVPVNV